MDNFKAIINILGCCISRDIFSYQKEDGNYKISKYVNEFDMLSVCGQPIPVDKAKFDDLDISDIMSNFTKRSLYLDMSKNVFEYIKEQNADYIIIDSGLTRFNQLKLNNSYVVSTPIRKKVLQRLYEYNIIPYKVDEELSVTEDIMNVQLQIFADEVKKIYKPEQIILVDILGAFFHDNGINIEPFRNANRWIKQNQQMRAGFNILKTAFCGCHVIPMPDAVAADTNHRLKLAVLHYTKEYYEYAYQCIEVINRKLPYEQEQKYITELLQQCTEYYYKKYYLQLAIELSNKNSRLLSEVRRSESRDIQAKFFRSMLLNKINMEDFLEKNNCKTVAIYGWTRVSEFFLEEFYKIGVTVAYVIESLPYANIGGHIVSGGVKVIKRNVKELPLVDGIFIADLLNKSQIVNVLGKITNVPIYSHDDILNL